MKKLMFVVFAGAFFACNSPEQNSATGNTEDSTTVLKDTSGNNLGEKGTGVGNSNGTNGSGTMTDTSHSHTDSLDRPTKGK